MIDTSVINVTRIRELIAEMRATEDILRSSGITLPQCEIVDEWHYQRCQILDELNEYTADGHWIARIEEVTQ